MYNKSIMILHSLFMHLAFSYTMIKRRKIECAIKHKQVY